MDFRHAVPLLLLAVPWLACSAGKSVAPSKLVACTNDDQCPADQGCQIDTPGDGYCSPLCTTNATCPAKTRCPDFTQTAGDCDDVGKHKGGQGACQQFTGARGPNTCSSATAFDGG